MDMFSLAGSEARARYFDLRYGIDEGDSPSPEQRLMQQGFEHPVDSEPEDMVPAWPVYFNGTLKG